MTVYAPKSHSSASKNGAKARLGLGPFLRRRCVRRDRPLHVAGRKCDPGGHSPEDGGLHYEARRGSARRSSLRRRAQSAGGFRARHGPKHIDRRSYRHFEASLQWENQV